MNQDECIAVGLVVIVVLLVAGTLIYGYYH